MTETAPSPPSSWSSRSVSEMAGARATPARRRRPMTAPTSYRAIRCMARGAASDAGAVGRHRAGGSPDAHAGAGARIRPANDEARAPGRGGKPEEGPAVAVLIRRYTPRTRHWGSFKYGGRERLTAKKRTAKSTTHPGPEAEVEPSSSGRPSAINLSSIVDGLALATSLGVVRFERPRKRARAMRRTTNGRRLPTSEATRTMSHLSTDRPTRRVTARPPARRRWMCDTYRLDCLSGSLGLDTPAAAEAGA